MAGRLQLVRPVARQLLGRIRVRLLRSSRAGRRCMRAGLVQPLLSHRASRPTRRVCSKEDQRLVRSCLLLVGQRGVWVVLGLWWLMMMRKRRRGFGMRI